MLYRMSCSSTRDGHCSSILAISKEILVFIRKSQSIHRELSRSDIIVGITIEIATKKYIIT